MANATKSWENTVPASSDSALSTPTFIKDLKIGLEERFNLEHIALNNDAAGVDLAAAGKAGRHNPGYVSAVLVNTLANIPTSGMYAGAMFYASDKGKLYIYAGSAWVTAPYTTQAFLAYPASDVQYSGTAQKIAFGTESFDDDGVFAASRATFKLAGYYQIGYSLSIELIAGATITAWLGRGAVQTVYAMSKFTNTTSSTIYLTLANASTLYVGTIADDYFEVLVTTTAGVAVYKGLGISSFYGHHVG